MIFDPWIVIEVGKSHVVDGAGQKFSKNWTTSFAMQGKRHVDRGQATNYGIAAAFSPSIRKSNTC